MPRTEVVYISGPYRAKSESEVWTNIMKARAIAIVWWRMGYTVICPHLNTMLMGGECPDEVWLGGDLELVKRSDIIVMLKGWRNSKGACLERQVAEENGKVIIEEVPDENNAGGQECLLCGRCHAVCQSQSVP